MSCRILHHRLKPIELRYFPFSPKSFHCQAHTVTCNFNERWAPRGGDLTFDQHNLPLRSRFNKNNTQRLYCLTAIAQKAKSGYQSIGSFHSENVETLIRLPEDEYTPPELPFPEEDGIFDEMHALRSWKQPPSCSTATNSVPFSNSHKFIPSYSHLDRNRWSFLNHGAFGLALDVGLRRAHSWRAFLESQPLRFFDRYLLDHLAYGARIMADLVGADGDTPEDKQCLREGTAMISNVTGGMNAVLGGHARCSRMKHTAFRDKVFYFDIAYGSTKKMCQTYYGRGCAVEIPFEEDFLPLLQQTPQNQSQNDSGKHNDNHPFSTEVFLSAFDAALRKLSNNEANTGVSDMKSSLSGSLLILDHITSNTAVHVPIQSIAKYAKEEYGMVAVADGAHGLLSLPLNMQKILDKGSLEGTDQNNKRGYVDVYLTNAHKWLSSTRGAALLFCTNPSLRDTILRQPAVVSHGVDDGFLSRFLWDGCRDYAAQLSLPTIANYWNHINLDYARQEMQMNLLEGVRILISHWHPDMFRERGADADTACIEKYSGEAGVTLVPMGMHAPMMALVRLPTHISGDDNDDKTSTDAKRVQDYLYEQNIEVPVKCIRRVLYVRVSCHLYNKAEEFEHLARMALKYKNI